MEIERDILVFPPVKMRTFKVTRHSSCTCMCIYHCVCSDSIVLQDMVCSINCRYCAGTLLLH